MDAKINPSKIFSYCFYVYSQPMFLAIINFYRISFLIVLAVRIDVVEGD